MPRGVAVERGRVVGHDHAVVASAVQDRHDARHVDVALVDEHLRVARHLALHVAEVDVADTPRLDVFLERLIDVHRAAGHLLQGAQAQLDLVGGRGRDVHQPLVFLGPVDQPRGAAQRLHRRVVGMQRECYAALLGDRQNALKKPAQPLPEFVAADLADHAVAATRPVAHVPHHAVRNRLARVNGTRVERHRHRAAAGKRAARPAPHAGDAEVVADGRHAGTAGGADRLLDHFDLRQLVRPVEQDVEPLRRVEVLDRGELQVVLRQLTDQPGQLVGTPRLSVARGAPAVSLAARDFVVLAAEIVDHMRHHMAGAGLPGEPEVARRECVSIKPEADVHRRFLWRGSVC